MANFNLSDAAKNILLGEDSKSTFDSNIASKKGGADKGGKLSTSVAYGQKDAGKIGDSPEQMSDTNPNYTAGSPTATPPGATPPVGSEPMKKLATQPSNQGSGDTPVQQPATDYSAIRDRIAGKRAAQTMKSNPGATFQSYGEETEVEGEEVIEEGQDVASAEVLLKRHELLTQSIRNAIDQRDYNQKFKHIEQIRDALEKHYGIDPDKMNEEVIEEEKEGHEDAAADKKLIKKMISKEKMKEDMDALLSGENLSEEFVTKATTIFEAAVIARAEEVIVEAEEQLMEEFEIAVEQIKEDMAAKVDAYLNYMVEEWMKDNQLAIQSGLKAEITEEFLTGLRDLFIEHHIDIPEDKVDIVEELAAQLEATEAVLNEEIARGIQLSQALNEQKKFEAIYTACEGLSQTQVEKMKSLAEGVDFTTEEEFVTKLETLKESYFKSDVKVASTDALDDEVLIEEEKKSSKSNDSEINFYAKTISQNLVK